jgi:KaiC/GvpD/RAD55 family RecA-like ATPase
MAKKVLKKKLKPAVNKSKAIARPIKTKSAKPIAPKKGGVDISAIKAQIESKLKRRTGTQPAPVAPTKAIVKPIKTAPKPTKILLKADLKAKPGVKVPKGGKKLPVLDAKVAKTTSGDVDTKGKQASSITPKSSTFDMSSIKAQIESKLRSGKIEETEAQVLEQRAPAQHAIENVPDKNGKLQASKNYVLTGVPGFDTLFTNGIPKGSAILMAGGAGSGKTIFSLQTLANHATKGKKCFYMSFEESEERLIQHMEDFGWDAKKMIKKGKLRIKRYSPFEITRSVDAMLAKEKGELLIKLDPVILPKGFKPDFIVLDSLTAVASAFSKKEDSYRIYIEQLFRFFEKIGSTSFLITETKQIPDIFSTTGVEEFLADGVIVLYNIKRGNVRESAIEILKMRGEKHQKKIVAMQISNNGITVYPEQEVFGGLD